MEYLALAVVWTLAGMLLAGPGITVSLFIKRPTRSLRQRLIRGLLGGLFGAAASGAILGTLYAVLPSATQTSEWFGPSYYPAIFPYREAWISFCVCLIILGSGFGGFQFSKRPNSS